MRWSAATTSRTPPGIRLHGEFGGGGDGSRGVPALRFQDDGGLNAARLLGDHEAELGIGDDHRRGEQALAGDAVEHLLKGRQGADQRHELLRHFFARYWPQARTGTTAQNHRNDELIRHIAISRGRAGSTWCRSKVE
jgi:hypothetical protein